MKTRQKLLSLFLVLLLVVCMAPAAFAELTFSGDQESISGEYDSTVFLAGESPNSSAKVKGILFEAGMTVGSAGSSEYAFMAGNTVTLTGSNRAENAYVTPPLRSESKRLRVDSLGWKAKRTISGKP